VTPEMAPALLMRGISKRFGRVVALDGVDLTVRPGTVHALLGENGAGKTTLTRVAFGLVQPDDGEIIRNGKRVRFRIPGDAIAAGIGMVHQHFSLIGDMTVAENVALGERGRFDRARAIEHVQKVSAETGLTIDARARVADLSVSQQQRVEIIKAFARAATLIILDEPTAILAPSEIHELLARLREYASAGHAVVLITHKLRDAITAADDITVLRRGRVVLTSRDRTATERDLVSAMVGAGSAPAAAARIAPNDPGDIVLGLDNVSVIDPVRGPVLRHASLQVRAGEIVGVAGVEGNGQRELLRVAAGRRAPNSGRVAIPDRVGFVPEDRQRDALTLDFSVLENVALANAGTRRGLLNWSAIEHSTQQIIDQFSIVAAGPHAVAGSLSGGNQQRLVLGREIADAPRAIVLENPTRGLDLHAAATVHERLRHARTAGMAALFYTSDLDELLALADRVLVCFAGTVHEVARDTDAIARALVGASA
jgi:ABC-type uncharacterized transport system ATPase subunit